MRLATVNKEEGKQEWYYYHLIYVIIAYTVYTNPL